MEDLKMVVRRKVIKNEGDNIGKDKQIDSRTDLGVSDPINNDLDDKNLRKFQESKEEVAKPLLNPKLSNRVEIHEIKTFNVNAKNRIDVEKALKTLLQSQDKIINVIPRRGTIYEVTVQIFRMRDE